VKPPSRPPDADPPTTRLAPSPTGALHLGNARTFLVNWALARTRGWRVLLRVEDLDGPRVRPEAAERAIDLLAWLGLDWDEGPIFQSADLGPYEHAMRALARAGLTYPSALSRRELAEASSAPHPGDAREARFPPELRPETLPASFDPGLEGVGWRFACPEARVALHDEVHGERSFSPHASVGDFVVWTKAGQPAYQLAVTVDDERQGVTHIVRGDDLLDSTARQTLLRRALGVAREPAHAHLPLVVGQDGRRLAKRHGDTRLQAYRDAGAPPERVVGLLAAWSGVSGRPEPMDARAFAERFDLDRMPRDPTVFREEHDAWLRERS
jgi:glutamyl-tRNA synthetase